MNKPLAYSYVRMSTAEQLKGDSLRRQVEASTKYALDHGLELVTDFDLKDLGVSAFKGDNAVSGRLSVFLEAVTSGKIPIGSYLIVESLDRLSRQRVTKAMRLFNDITESGINIVTLADNQLYKAGSDDFIPLITSMIIMSRAYEESEIKSQRIGAAWSNKRTNIAVTKLTAMCPNWLSLNSTSTAFDALPDRVAVVVHMFKMAVEGHGTNSITRHLNATGVSPFGKSASWYDSYVAKVLNNRAVLGEFQPHSKVAGVRSPVGQIVSDYYPQIISEDLFLRVQVARRKRSTGSGGRKGKELKNLFTHLAECAYCGSPMGMIDKGRLPKGGRYLKCSNAIRRAGCTVSTGWRYSSFETSFLFFAQALDLTGILQSAESQSELDVITQRLVALDEKALLAKAKRDKTYDLISVSGTEFVALKLAECEIELSDIEALRVQLQSKKDALNAVSPLSSAELMTQITTLQALTGPDAYSLRTLVASKLRDIVISLKLAVNGQAPQRVKMAAWVGEQESDQGYIDQIMDHIAAKDKEAGLNNSTFTIVFADNVQRQVIVDKSDPTTFVQLADFDMAGQATIARHDRPTIIENRPRKI